jgi:hypothetical protein
LIDFSQLDFAGCVLNNRVGIHRNIDVAILPQKNGLLLPKQATGFEPRFAKQTKEFRHFSL